jgi:hypothetical protein
MMEDFWIWKSNICLYEGIGLNVIDELLDILGEGGGSEFRRLRLFNGMSLES